MTEDKKDKVAPKKKATAKPKAAGVRYIKLYNNMRCPWIAPFSLVNHAAYVNRGDAPLNSSALYSTKSYVLPGQSIKLDKEMFENYVVNKNTGVVNVPMKAWIDNRNLIVADVKERVDLRDPVDADVKRNPTPLRDDATGKSQEVLLREPLTLQVSKSRTVEVSV